MKIKGSVLIRCISLVFALNVISHAGAQELWLSCGTGVGKIQGTFSSVSILNIDGAVGLYLLGIVHSPLRAGLELNYTGYMLTEEVREWVKDMQGIQGIFDLGYRVSLGTSFALTPHAGAGIQCLFTSSILDSMDYLASSYTNRTGVQFMMMTGLGAEYVPHEDWAISLDIDYRLLAETGGSHHGAAFTVSLSRKLADFGGTSKQYVPLSSPGTSSRPAAAIPEEHPSIASLQGASVSEESPQADIDFTPLKGNDNIRVLQDGKMISIVIEASFPPNEAGLAERMVNQLALVGGVLRDLRIESAKIAGYVAEVGDDEAGLDLELSLVRAIRVRDWFLSNGFLRGLKDVSVEGRSAADPVADNATEEGRARNRRVEILVNLE